MKRFAKALANSRTEDPLWRVVFDMEARELPEPSYHSYGELITRYWDASLSRDFAIHLTNEERSGFFEKSFWVESGTGRRAWQTKGSETTAGYLAAADHDPLRTASVWLQASLIHANHTASSLSEILPSCAWLEEQAAKVVRVEYHQRSWDLLPVRLHLPQRAILTPEDFIRMACSNFITTLARYTPVTLYLLSYSEEIAERRAA